MFHGYDPLNRLISAQNAGTDCTKTLANGKTEYWGNSYSYDAWGNLLSKSVTKCSAESLSVTAAANNQLQGGYLYDDAGNMTHDATNGWNYAYDQESRITGANGFTYTYDGDGNRVEKSNGSTGTIYWYMTPGIVAESDLSGNLQSEYVFFDGVRVARKDFPGGAVSYYFSDQLKTTDIVTDAQGNIKNESDFYPWGGELQLTSNDSNHYKFTGKERDSETGLDYFGARYYSNGLGRFITPDWAAKPAAVPYAVLGDPQTLNLYAYVGGNPTSKADPDGHSSDPMGLAVQYAWNWLVDHLPRASQSTASGPQVPMMPHFPYLPPRPCPPQDNNTQKNDSKQNNNNSNSNNAQEQGRDAQGKFLPKKGGESAPGAAAEKQGLDSVGAVKNTEKLNGTIRDGTIPKTGRHVEIKSGESVNNTGQLRSMGQTAVDNTGQPLKVVTTNPNVKVSGKALANENLEFEHKPPK